MEPETLVCRRCKLPKPIYQFYLRHRGNCEWRDRICTDCKAVGQTDRDRERRTGFTPELFATCLKAQDGKCAICKQTETLVADHSHSTGKPRALLCNRCNRVLGLSGEDLVILKSMIEYILKYSEET